MNENTFEDSLLSLLDQSSPEYVLYFMENSFQTALFADALLGRSIWVDPFLAERKEKGEFARLYFDLLEDDSKFFKYFRMSKSTFEKILNRVRKSLTKFSNFRDDCISPEERLMVTFRFLSTGLAFNSLFFCFRIAPCTIQKIVYETCNIIWEMFYPIHMPHPTRELMEKSALGFLNEWGFANCCGAIDGKHVSIDKPDGTAGEHYNYMGYHSIVLQGVADPFCKFICIDVGGYGRQSDGGTLRSTPIYNQLSNGSFPLPDDRELPHSNVKSPFVLIGDEAYPLRRFLMRPYPGTNLTEERKVFNQRLSRARQVIECAFGILVAKWRCLRNQLEVAVDKAELITKVCCLLHNLIIDEEGLMIKPDLRMAGVGQRQFFGRQFNNSSREAIRVRETLCSYYNSSIGQRILKK